jgi:hypothetical protein
MSKQTAIEWLHEIAKQREPDKFDWQQAKEMYKQETIDAWEDGHDSFSTRNAEQYYEQTYGGNKC